MQSLSDHFATLEQKRMLKIKDKLQVQTENESSPEMVKVRYSNYWAENSSYWAEKHHKELLNALRIHGKDYALIQREYFPDRTCK
jgi:hypothetical protein